MSATITVSMIKELRERTGIGMSKCKSALTTADGDMELAIANLRKEGLATAVKKEGREAKEGLVTFKSTDSHIAIAEVNAETDFVVKNDKFLDFLSNIIDEIVQTQPASLEDFLNQKYSKDSSLTVDEYRATIVQMISENIQIRRIELISKESGHSYGLYSHMGGKIFTLVDLEGSDDDESLAKDIAMHIAAEAPEYLSPDEVPASIIDNERDIAKSQMKGKPANIIDKILGGKVQAFHQQVCLIKQKYVKDSSLSVEAFLAQQSKEKGKSYKIKRFIRWQVAQ
jgi:elongation factor Ts